MSSQRVVHTFLLWCAFAFLAVSNAFATEYHGQVTFNGLPLPGATLTATQGDKKLVAVSDSQGVYSFADLPDGTWSIDIQMTGFAELKQDVTIAVGAAPGAFELKLMSLAEIRSADKPVKAEQAPPVLTGSIPAAPTQVADATPGAPAPAGAGKKAAAAPAKGTAAAAGTQQAAAAPPPEPDPQAADGLLINGSVNNAATSQYAMSQAFGNNRSGGRSLYNGGLMLLLDNSALDANQYSLTGLPTPKQSFNNFTTGITVGGPIKLPHWNPRNFRLDLQYQHVQRSTDQTQSALVPTLAQQGGDLSQQTTPIYAPTTGLPSACTSSGVVPGTVFAGNKIPAVCISPTATALLKFYPLPNVATTPSSRNDYQIQTANNVRQDGFQMRSSKPITTKDFVFGNLALQSTRTGNTSLFGFHDTTDQLSMSVSTSWSHRFTQRVFLNTSYNFSRSRTLGTPFFANRLNIEGQDNILGVDTEAADWGPPGLGFVSGFQGLSDSNTSRNRNETNSVSVDLQWNRSRHIIDVGGDFRRQEFNYFSQSNPRGSFGFSGAATNGGITTAGSDLADFLLGIPDTSAISYGNPDKYLRQSVYDLFGQDDFRVNPELSIKAGVRWEYGAPITETQGRMVNLDIAPGFTAQAPVTANSPTGPLTGQGYPSSLVRPDRSGIAPNIGIAWRPISGSSLLIRSGYQITHETSVYQAVSLLMATQTYATPITRSLSLNNAVCPLSLTTGFPNCASITPDSFAIDPNFRVGYVQTWNLSAQRDLPGSLQMIATYTGIKGTRGSQEFAPNTYPYGGVNPCPSCPIGFLYRTSNGNSTREAASLVLRRRLRAGFTANLNYTYSKAIDDDYTFASSQGSSASPQVAQDWRNPKAQRGLSTFDQRNVFALQMQYTTGMGMGTHALMGGWRGTLYKDWTVLTNLSVADGTPETPTYTATVPGTGFSNIFRANYTGAPIHASAPGLFINPAAFAAPAAGTFGNARRDSIPGPDQFSLNASMQRSFRYKDRYTLDARIDANNVLNHVVYSQWYNTVSSSTPNLLFGTPSSVNNMRSVTITLRLRYF